MVTEKQISATDTSVAGTICKFVEFMSTYATIQLVGSSDINFDAAAAAASILLRSIHRRRRRRSNDSFVWNLQRIDNIKCAANGENKSEKIQIFSLILWRIFVLFVISRCAYL